MKLYQNLLDAMSGDANSRENKLVLIALEALAEETDYRLHRELMTNLTNLYFETNQELIKTLKKIEKMATEDHLTQLYNRIHFTEMANYEVEKQKRYPEPLCLIMFDIDHFKNVNDTYGHDIGDLVLVSISKEVKDKVRKTDTLARWGGEEFVILLPDTNLDNAGLVAESLRYAIEVLDISPVKQITCSFGISQFNEFDDINSFMKRADEALYNAKHSGRNKVCHE
jgi:diguanylate cyclase (GGDEF)-like protein